MKRGPLQLHLRSTRVRMKQLQGQGRLTQKNQVEVNRKLKMKVLFHGPKNNFTLPPGPVPEPGFHNPKNNFKLPAGPAPEPGFHKPATWPRTRTS
eukprot:3405253-Prorocentrum_lima.AAC.1